MSANPKPTGDQGAGPSSERRATQRRRISSDAIRTLRYEFQVDAGEDYLEDMSWRPFTNLKKRGPVRLGKPAAPSKSGGNGRAR